MNEMNADDLCLKAVYPVTSADTDMHSRLKISALVNYLIQTAISSAEHLGFGFSALKKEQLFWVLNRLTVEIYRPLKWSEKAEVETWPKNIERIFYIRDFIVRDEQGEIVAKASSAWLSIDINSKRPGLFKGDKIEAFSKLNDYHALEYSPLKLNGIEKKDLCTITPSYFDIDLNRHVTSTRYIDWMMDHFSLDFHQTNYPKHLSVNYIKETMHGETIELSHDNKATTHNFEGFNSNQQKVAFRGQIDF